MRARFCAEMEITFTWMHAFCKQVYKLTDTYTHMYTCKYVIYCTCVHPHIHTHVYTYTQYMYTCMHTYICTYIHIHVHTYIHKYTHTHTHTYTHTKLGQDRHGYYNIISALTGSSRRRDRFMERLDPRRHAYTWSREGYRGVSRKDRLQHA